MNKNDMNQIRKDIERINLHPILLNEAVRAQIHSILITFVTMNNFPLVADSSDKKNENSVSYIQGIDTIASTLYVTGFESQNNTFIEMIPTMLK